MVILHTVQILFRCRFVRRVEPRQLLVLETSRNAKKVHYFQENIV